MTTKTENIDYITFSTKNWRPIDDVIGQAVETRPTIGNYAVAIKYECGCIVQWHPQQERLKTHVTLSGGTLARWREYGISDKETIEFAQSLNKTKFGRIDIAVTAYGKFLKFTPERAWELYTAGKMKSALKADKPVVDIEKNVETFYAGSRKSRNRLLRVYDKGIEQGGRAGELVRIELESRRAANTVAREIVANVPIQSIIRRVIDFDSDDWTDIMSAPPAQRMRREDVQKTDIAAKKDWLLNSVSPAIANLAKEIGWDDPFWDKFSTTTAFRFNKKD